MLKAVRDGDLKRLNAEVNLYNNTLQEQFGIKNTGGGPRRQPRQGHNMVFGDSENLFMNINFEAIEKMADKKRRLNELTERMSLIGIRRDDELIRAYKEAVKLGKFAMARFLLESIQDKADQGVREAAMEHVRSKADYEKIAGKRYDKQQALLKALTRDKKSLVSKLLMDKVKPTIKMLRTVKDRGLLGLLKKRYQPGSMLERAIFTGNQWVVEWYMETQMPLLSSASKKKLPTLKDLLYLNELYGNAAIKALLEQGYTKKSPSPQAAGPSSPPKEPTKRPAKRPTKRPTKRPPPPAPPSPDNLQKLLQSALNKAPRKSAQERLLAQRDQVAQMWMEWMENKYKGVARVSKDFIRYDGGDQPFPVNKIRDPIRGKSPKRYLFIRLHYKIGLGRIKSMGYHANMLIYDFTNNKLYRFEPMGYEAIDAKAIDDVLTKNFSDLGYTNLLLSCPRIGAQRAEQSPSDFCLIWGLLFMDVFLKAKTKDIKKIHDMIVDQGKKREGGLRKVIQSYISYVVDKLKI